MSENVTPKSPVYSQRLKRLLYSLIAVTVVLVWLNQSSINTYYQQKYHQDSPIEWLNHYRFWQVGDGINQRLNSIRDHRVEYLRPTLIAMHLLRKPPTPEVVELPPVPIPEPLYQCEIPEVTLSVTPLFSYKNKESFISKKIIENNKQPIQQATRWALKKNQKVFFVGDSMMQGVALHAVNQFKKDHDIQSVNLSKQSTGLAYPKFFDWPQTVRDTLANNKDIGLMVVMLGANDPWDMPGGKGKPYLRFKSEEWKAIYIERIDEILELAHINNVNVIWIGAPIMKRESLSESMQFLNTLYEQESKKFQAIYISSNKSLGYGDSTIYDTYSTVDGKQTKIRTDDGIHFTPVGQKLISNTLMSIIDVE